MEVNFSLPEDEDPDVLAEDNTRPSLPEDFPNFRDFQIEKMVLHFRVVTDGSEQRLRLGFKCKLCNEVFNKTMQLLGHIRNHFEENHSCKDCGKYFFDTNKLHIHKRAKHTQALRCQLGCPNYTTSNIKCLQTHYLRYHCLKVRPREMKKMDSLGSLFRPSDIESKIRAHREQLADRQRSLPVVVQQQHQQQSPQLQAEPEAEEDFEDDDTNEEATEQDQDHEPEEDEYDELDDYEQPVECCVCDTYIPNEDILQVHEATHGSPYSCKICSSAFERLEDARSHYAAHEKTPVLQNPPQIQTITLTPATQLQQATIPLVTASPGQQQQQAAPTPTVATMIIMHNGTPMLVPVQTFDSSQLVPATFSPPQAAAPQIPQQSSATTITPITATWPISQLLPVNNQIEIIPIHSTQQMGQSAGSSTTAAINPQTAIPIQNIINLRQDPGAAAGHPGGGIVITPVTTIDPNYLRQQQVLQMQLQQQQQQHFQQQFQPQS